MSVTRTPSVFKSIANASRLYSSEAVAAETTRVEEAVSGDVVDFHELSKLGVHQNLLQAITRDMNYKTMTPVQSKTINPALKGTDM